MVISQLYDNDTEWTRHAAVMQGLARDLKTSLKEVSETYETALGELKKTARVKDFVVVLVARRVKELMKEKSAHSKEKNEPQGQANPAEAPVQEMK